MESEPLARRCYVERVNRRIGLLLAIVGLGACSARNPAFDFGAGEAADAGEGGDAGQEAAETLGDDKRVGDADAVLSTAEVPDSVAARSLEAGLVAKEAAREISKEEYEAQRLPYALVDYKRRGGKVQAMEVTLTEGLRDTVKFLADEEGKFVFTAFEYKSAFVFAMGPGTKGFLASLGRSSMAKDEGLLAAHARSGGCQVCAFVDGSQSAASTYGRHRRGMTEERRKEAEKLLPKLRQGDQSPVYLRIEPGALRLSYLLDMSVISAGKKREELWEAFMKAIGARGESVSDPREWLFG